MGWFDSILYPLMVAVAWIMVQFHGLLVTLGLDHASGGTWALSIVGLVIVMRIILIPLFVKQIKASRGMQLLAPDMQKIQKKYKGKTDPASREAMSRETMELYRKHGTNPFSSCLPILAQSPIFFALFRVLYSMPQLADGTYSRDNLGPLTQNVAQEFTDATLFGARLSDWFLQPTASVSVKVLAAVLIVLMSATTFFTQRQLTRKNMPATALQGPMAQQQKVLLYILPLVFAISGVNFPIGVLIYWTTTNLWSMGQQFYVIRRNPTPGSEAERLLKERRAKKAAARGIVLEEEKPEPTEEKPRGQRVQPKRKDRAKGGGGAAAAPGAARSGASGKSGGPAKPGAKPAGSGKPGGPAKSGSGAKGDGPAKSGNSSAKAAGSGRASTAQKRGAPDGTGPTRPGGSSPSGAKSSGKKSGAARKPGAGGKSGASGDAVPRKSSGSAGSASAGKPSEAAKSADKNGTSRPSGSPGSSKSKPSGKSPRTPSKSPEK